MGQFSVYSKLKRLFSTNTVVRNVGGKKLRVVDADQIQSFVNRKAIDRYNRVYSSQTGGYGSAHGRHEAAQTYQGARLQLFRDYDMMDADPIISSVLDIYADEATVKNEFNQMLAINSDNQQIQEILHNLFYDILNIEFNMWPWIRNMCKYGDFFMYLNIHPEYGIVNTFPLSVYETIRIEGGEEDGNPFSVQFEIENDFLAIGKKKFENFEVAHFRLLSDINFLPYGKAMVENGRRIWKQLQLMEDAMLIHRIMRAPDKRKIMVDIGNIPPNEIDTFMNKIINKMKKTPIIDERTGEYNLRFNMMNITEDIYLPVRGKDSATDITTLPGLQFNAIEDIQYLLRKLMAAFKVPKAFIGYEEDISGKATLAAQDVRFAKTIERIQRIMVSELTKIAVTHLYVQGFRDEELVNFSLELTSPSTLYEQEKISLWTDKIALADSITNSKMLSRHWVYTNILNISEDEIETQMEKITEEVKVLAELEKMQQQLSAPEAPPGEGVPGEAPVDGEEGGDGEDPGAAAGAEDITKKIVDALDKIGGGAGFDAKGLSKRIGKDDPDEEEDDDDNEDSARPSKDRKTKLIKPKMGRPKAGFRRKVDSHPLGRDPFGNKENRNALKRESLGTLIQSLELLDKREYKGLIAESTDSEDTPTD